jgi:hypothetical protein
VIVCKNFSSIRVAKVSYLEGSSADVIYEDPYGDEDEGCDIPRAQLTACACSDEELLLQSTLLMNLCRVNLKLDRKGKALTFACYAATLLRFLHATVPWLSQHAGGQTVQELFVKSLALRCNVLLVMGRPKFAQQVPLTHSCMRTCCLCSQCFDRMLC